MILPAILDPFADRAAPAVMTRLALDWILQGDTIDPLLDEVAHRQYSREFLLAHFVEVLADVACGFRPSVRSAFLRRQLQDVASIRAFYAKLAIYEPASGIVGDVILEENAHDQQRSLFGRISIGVGQLWIMDRNFCVRSLLDRIASSGSYFLARWHASALPFEELGPPADAGRGEGGAILEQPIRAAGSPEQAGLMRLRRIVLRLDEPTRAGESEIVLVTNLPDDVSAQVCCGAYRDRWRIERHFQRLTDLLHCEVPTLGYPRAALFAFCMSVVAGNALAILLGSLRAAHGEELADELSEHALVGEAAEVYPGMMVAAAPSVWPATSGVAATELAGLLSELAARVPVHRMLRSPRGPKRKRPPATSGRRIHHMATKKLLEQAGGLSPPAKARPRRTTR